MKKIKIALVATGLFVFFFFAKAQAQKEQDKVYNFTTLDTQPTYPGGISSFYDFIANTIKYPEKAIQNKTEGNVYLSFTVEKDGSLNDIKVEKGLGNDTDEEALRVLKLSKKWNPGMIKGKPVKAKYILPIKFALKPNSSSHSSPGREIATVIIKAFPKGAPLIIINKTQSNMSNVLDLSPEKVSNIQLLQPTKAVKEFGDKGKNGVVLITSNK